MTIAIEYKKIFHDIEEGKLNLQIPVMVLAEIGYLAERNKIETNLQKVDEYCRQFPTVQSQPITHSIILTSFEIDDIPELHDRIIAGTAC